MGAVTITVDSTESFKQRVKAVFSGKRQEQRISFESFELFWSTYSRGTFKSDEQQAVKSGVEQS